MQRRLDRLASSEFDVVIVGAGIYGACLAWDAALRGLSVALIDQADFGWATSANMHRILHGGFRYLRNADVKRIRESVRERRIIMRLAPHLSEPQPVLVPTYRSGVQHRELMRAAITLHGLLSWDRNQGIAERGRQIPGGRIISLDECLSIVPGLDSSGVTGGAIFYDGSLHDPARLTLEFVRSAVDCGACAANYVQASGYLRNQGRVTGVAATDVLTGEGIPIRGRLVINACGPWINDAMNKLGLHSPSRSMRYVRSITAVTKPLTAAGHGFAFMGPQPGRPDSIMRYFIAPWRGFSIVGSVCYLHGTDPDAWGASASELEALIDATRRAIPGAGLSMDDIVAAQGGLIPHDESEPMDDPNNHARHYRIVDHERRDGIPGVLSVVGIKYTTARDVAEKTIDLAVKKLGKGRLEATSGYQSLHCSDIADLDGFLADAERSSRDGVAPGGARQLAREYGSKYPEVLALAAADPSLARPLMTRPQVLAGQVVHAVQKEMACRLSDVAVRRTAMAADGHPGPAVLRACAEIMAPLLGWTAERVSSEVIDTEAYLRRFWTRASN